MNAIREETIVPEALERLLRTALIGAGATAVMDAGIAYESVSVRTPDHREGVAALKEKRAPRFGQA